MNAVDVRRLISRRSLLRLGVQVEDVKRIFGGLDLPDVLYNRQYLSPPAIELTQAAREIAGIMIEADLLQRMPPLEGLFRSHGLPTEPG